MYIASVTPYSKSRNFRILLHSLKSYCQLLVCHTAYNMGFYVVNQAISAFIDQLLNTNVNQNVVFSTDLQLFGFLCN